MTGGNETARGDGERRRAVCCRLSSVVCRWMVDGGWWMNEWWMDGGRPQLSEDNGSSSGAFRARLIPACQDSHTCPRVRVSRFSPALQINYVVNQPLSCLRWSRPVTAGHGPSLGPSTASHSAGGLSARVPVLIVLGERQAPVGLVGESRAGSGVAGPDRTTILNETIADIYLSASSTPSPESPSPTPWSSCGSTTIG